MQENDSTKKLQIPLTISTEFKLPDSKFNRRRMQSDLAAAYCRPLFYFMKMAIRGHDYLDLSTEEAPLLDFQDLRANIHAVCEIGEALLNEVEAPSGTNDQSASIAEMLSQIINSSTTPGKLRNLLEVAITEFGNEHIDQDKANDILSSPEYIGALIDGYDFSKDGEDEDEK